MKKSFYKIITVRQIIFSLFALCCVLVSLLSVKIIFFEGTSAVNASVQTAKKIIIDAGHGGEDGGTKAKDGTLEKDINLSIALKCREVFLSAGYDVITVRETDREIYDEGAKTIREKKVSDTKNRMKLIEDNPDAVFLSIHQNYYTEAKYHGAQVFFSPNNPDSETVASCIQKSIVSSLQPDNTRQIKATGKEIYLLYHAKSPAVMVECGFLSNEEETQKLKDDAYQSKLAMAIFYGIEDYFNGKD